MSKIFLNTKRILIVFLCMVAAVTLVGCTDDGPAKFKVSFEPNNGTTMDAIYVTDGEKIAKVPEDPIKKDYKFIGWFTEKELTNQFDFQTPIVRDINLYAKWEEVIVEDEIAIEIVGVNLPASIVAFNNAKTGSENPRSEFIDLTKNYIVGDDNAWTFKPATTFVKHNITQGTFKPTSVDKWEYEVKIYQFITDKYVPLADNTMVDAIDNFECAIDFSEKAIGEKFKVEVFPKNLTVEQEQENTNSGTYTVSVEIEVVDGYNAYNTYDLSYVDNQPANTHQGQAWREIRKANNLPESLDIKSIIFHNNIVVKNEELPKSYFLGPEEVKESHSDYETAMGSLRDHSDIFHRTIAAGDAFKIYGNYFNLDMSNIRLVVREDDKISSGDKPLYSHAQLFRFDGTEQSFMEMDSLNITGNAPKVENVVKSGGLILSKASVVSFRIYNTIATRCFISYFAEQSHAEQLIEKSKAYDSYNTFVYLWGAANVTIKDCEMVGAGGPCIIQDHIRPNEPNEVISSSTIINSNLQSWVAGTEGWFIQTGASALIPNILSMDALFNPFGKTYLNQKNGVPYFNFILVNKDGHMEGASKKKVEGSCTIDGSVSDYGATNPYLRGMTDTGFNAGAPVFQSSETVGAEGFGLYAGGQFMKDVQNQDIMSPENKLFKGNYLTLYYNGMMVIFEYNQVK